MAATLQDNKRSTLAPCRGCGAGDQRWNQRDVRRLPQLPGQRGGSSGQGGRVKRRGDEKRGDTWRVREGKASKTSARVLA